MTPSLSTGYHRLLWGSMEVLNIDRSVERKIMAAVAIQFGVSVIQAFLPSLFSGTTRLAISVGLLGVATVAFANTLLIARHDIVTPLERLEEAASRLARGDLDVDLPQADQGDEIGSLATSFGDMHGYFQTVADQASALTAKRFDDPSLDTDLPGRFGYLLAEMAESLRTYVGRIEADRDRFKLLNYLVSHDISNIVMVLEGYTAELRDHVEDEEARDYLEIIEEQTDEIESVIETVQPLTDSRGLEWLDLSSVLRDEIETVVTATDGLAVEGLESLPEGYSIRANRLLSSVFRNVLTNAVEHNDAEEPRIRVSVSKPTETMYNVDIADNGPGIPPERRENFFETADPGSGTDIIRTIVARFGGDIWVEPAEGGGTVVRMLVPRDASVLEQPDGESMPGSASDPF